VLLSIPFHLAIHAYMHFSVSFMRICEREKEKEKGKRITESCNLYWYKIAQIHSCVVRYKVICDSSFDMMKCEVTKSLGSLRF